MNTYEENDAQQTSPEAVDPASDGSQLVTVADAIKWAMDLCREAAQNAMTLTLYYSKGQKYKKLADEARQKVVNAKVAIAHLERVLDENNQTEARP